MAVPTNGFVITIQTNNTDNGSYSATEFTIPTIEIGYNYNVDCNDDGAFEATVWFVVVLVSMPETV